MVSNALKKGVDMFSKSKMILIATLVAVTVGFQADWAEARIFHRRHSCHRKHHYRPHPLWGRIVRIPRALVRLVVGGRDYYYDDGLFYIKDKAGQYVVVAPPIGGVIVTLPARHKRILVNGRTYYYYNDVYYAKHKGGYIVVDDPVYAIETLPEKVDVLESASAKGIPEISRYTVHIPGKDGSYLPIELARQGDGYIGPQGEYYPEFPSIEQLKAMYVK
jgi:hypothetical protein